MLKSEEALYLDKKLQLHVEHCDAQFEEGRNQFRELVSHSKAITKAVNQLADDMEPIIELKEDLQGAAHLGMRIQKFGFFIVKWPVIGAGLYAIYNWAIDLLPK